jgi:Spy/CpxP family protein refolding chaperone
MDRINGFKALGFASMIALGATLAVSSSVFAEDAKKDEAKKEAPKKEAAPKKEPAAKKPDLGIYAQWAKDLGLDDATKAKLADIHAKQEEATKEKAAKLTELTKDGKGKSEDAVKLKAEILKTNSEFKAQAYGVLTPEQQKKISVQMAYKSVVMTAPFKQVTLSADQQKKIMDKLEASGDLLNDQKEVDFKKLAPITKELGEQVLTADQKAVIAAQIEENKAKAAAAKKDAPAKKEPAPAAAHEKK